MCMKSPRPVAPPPTPAPPPPPEKPPSELEDAVDSNATALKRKRSGVKGALGRGKAGAQIANTAKAAVGTGLKIGS